MPVDAHVRVYQLKTDHGGAYMNVHHEESGVVGVWGHAYETPTYLITSGQNWHLLVFADEQWRDEGLAAYAYRWNADHIFELPSMKDVTASWGGKQ